MSARRHIQPCGPKSWVSANTIISCVADEFGVMHNELRSNRRHKETIAARQLAEWLCGQLTFATVTDIGREFGGRDHTSIQHGIEKAGFRLRHDGIYRQRCMNVLRKIEGQRA